MKTITSVLALGFFLFSSLSAQAVEHTLWGKITGMETREWGLIVNVDFSVGQSLGCPRTPSDTYMLYLHETYSSNGGGNFAAVQSSVLTAFASGSDIAFHLYQCTVSGGVPYIGHVRLRK